jgi:hypothetical protein
MTYDWDGQRARRMMMLKLATAGAAGLSVPLAISLLTYMA